MDTPICDFVRAYAKSGTMRLHMPGHKGMGILGVEHLDITEIDGADSLYEAEGIIARSEANASRLFGCPTFYSTEGSSQCIRAMLYLVMLHAKKQGRGLVIAAGRNAHRTFLTAVALLDVKVQWLYPEDSECYLSCDLTPRELEEYLEAVPEKPAAVYLTSPDYLGQMAHLRQIADVCHRHGVLLAVDNAHGAYLHFLSPSGHPMDLGADLCCDSAHKTLPVLTGGAYLHIRDPWLAACAKDALALFGSTSPSYLILQSLDAANAILDDRDYLCSLSELRFCVAGIKEALTAQGLTANISCESLKITVYPKLYGYTGTELAAYLRKNAIECEFADPDYLVLMVTPAVTREDLARLVDILKALPRRAPILIPSPEIPRGEAAMTVREAMLSPGETIPVHESLGRILAAPSVGCPPAVPIVVCGERIDERAIACFEYYGIETCRVVREEEHGT